MASGKIVHLSSVHHARDNRIFHKECKSLAQAGYNVTLIAVADQDFIEEGVRVRGVPKFTNRTKRIFMAPWRVYQMALEERADLYHFHDSELIPIALLLRLQGYKVVYDVHENLAPSILSKDWIHPFLRSWIAKAVDIIEKVASGYFNGIVVVVPPMLDRFPPHTTILLRNFSQLKELPIITSDLQDPMPMPPYAVYVGVISKDRGALDMVSAMGLLEETSPIQLFLGGNVYPDTLKDQLAGDIGFDRTTLLGWLTRDQVIETFRRSFVGLSILHATPHYLMAYPTKLFEYMGMGLPVIGNQFEIVQDIIVGNQCGITVPEKDPQAIANALQWLFTHPEEAQQMGIRGRQAIEEKYNWEKEMDSLLNLYAQILKCK